MHFRFPGLGETARIFLRKCSIRLALPSAYACGIGVTYKKEMHAVEGWVILCDKYHR